MRQLAVFLLLMTCASAQVTLTLTAGGTQFPACTNTGVQTIPANRTNQAFRFNPCNVGGGHWNAFGVVADDQGADRDITLGGVSSARSGGRCDALIAHGREGSIGPLVGTMTRMSAPLDSLTKAANVMQMGFHPLTNNSFQSGVFTWDRDSSVLRVFEFDAAVAGTYRIRFSRNGGGDTTILNWRLYEPGLGSGWRRLTSSIHQGTINDATHTVNLSAGWHCLVVYKDGIPASSNRFYNLFLEYVFPAPSNLSVSPGSVPACAGPRNITINGNGLTQSSQVIINNAPQPSSFANGSLMTTIPASALTTPGLVPIVVSNPGPGGGMATVNLTVNPSPTAGIGSLSPPERLVGSGTFTLTVNGSNFTPTSQVVFNGSPKNTFYVNSNALTATIPGSDILTPGLRPVRVDDPCFGQSPTVHFRVCGIPNIAGLSPSPILACTTTTVRVTGSHFTSASTVLLNGGPAATTYLSDTALDVQVPAGLVPAPTTLTVTVNAPCNGATNLSNSSFLPVVHSMASASSLSPPSVPIGSPSFDLDVFGSGFTPTSTVQFDGIALGTTLISNGHVRGMVPASLLTSQRTVQVVVSDPCFGTTSPVPFDVECPTPVLNTISPTEAVFGDPGLTLTVDGSDFCPMSVVRWDSLQLTTTFVNSNRLTAWVPSSLLSTVGEFSVDVDTPGPGGGFSTTATFEVTVVYPGTNEDFVLRTGVNSSTTTTGQGQSIKNVSGADALLVEIESPNGTAVGFSHFLFVQLFTTGVPPVGPVPRTYFADPTQGGTFIMIGPGPIWSDALLLPGPNASAYALSQLPPGTSLMLQAASVNPFATVYNLVMFSDAHELRY